MILKNKYAGISKEIECEINVEVKHNLWISGQKQKVNI